MDAERDAGGFVKIISIVITYYWIIAQFVDGVLANLINNEEIALITSSEFEEIFRNDTQQRELALPESVQSWAIYQNWKQNTRQMFIPINIGGHWILAHAKSKFLSKTTEKH